MRQTVGHCAHHAGALAGEKAGATRHEGGPQSALSAVVRRARQTTGGEWQRLRLELEKAGGKAWRERTERTVWPEGGRTVITYTFPSGATAWRYASESKLHRKES
jgi:hypothetical protein